MEELEGAGTETVVIKVIQQTNSKQTKTRVVSKLEIYLKGEPIPNRSCLFHSLESQAGIIGANQV